MRRLYIFNRFMVGLLLATTLLGSPFMGIASAQSNGLGVRPKIEVTVKPGEKIKESAFVRNPNLEQPLKVKLSLVDFRPADDSGVPQFLLNNESTPWSAKSFITIPSEATVEANKSVNIPFDIEVPENQGAGSYYAAIRFAAVTEETDKQVALSASNTSLVFIRVPGQATELLKLVQFGAYESEGSTGKYKSIFVSKPPVKLSYKLKNEGNVAEQPNGTIVIKNMFGKKAYVLDNINNRRELALIGQTRRFEICISEQKGEGDRLTGVCEEKLKTPGRYTADLTVIYGENGSDSREINAKTSFWYLPAWSIAVILVVVGAVVLAVVLTMNKFKRGSRRRK